MLPRSPKAGFELRRLQRARTCYDHLAGGLGIGVSEALVDRHHLDARGDGYEVTRTGEGWLHQLGVDCDRVRVGQRAFARARLDWSGRRPHLAGALGAAVARRFFELRWIVRIDGSRAVAVTPDGRRALRRELDLVL